MMFQCNENITKAFNSANSNEFMVLKGGLPHMTVAGVGCQIENFSDEIFIDVNHVSSTTN